MGLQGSVAEQAQAQVEKRCYKNQTAGWLGVVKLDHLGAQVGESIPPYGTAWLTDDEAILTARAPADPKDNPFEEQMFMFQDEQGVQVEQLMRPLVLTEDERFSPSDERFVPGQVEDEGLPPAVAADVNLHAAAANAKFTDAALAADSSRPVPTTAVPAEEIKLAPSSSAAVPPSMAAPGVPPGGAAPGEPEEDTRPSWTEPAQDLTPTPKPGSLQGSNEGAASAPKGELPPLTGSGPSQTQIPHTPGAAAAGAPSEQAAEEHAGVTQAGEETGAADLPEGAQTEGEFASHEEVGSPDAPNQSAESGEAK